MTRVDGHVETVYGDTYFWGGGAGYPDYLSEGPLLREHGRWYARLLKQHTAPGSVLDVGCAAGFVLRGLCDLGWAGVGVEPNVAMAKFGREQLGVRIAASTFEDYLDDHRYDLVSMIQVLPHFIDPRKAFSTAAHLTKPNGFWIIETWDRASWTARLMGKRWHEYSPPSVLHWFSRSGIRDLAAEFDFSEIATGRPAKRLTGDHARSLINHKFESPLVRRLLALPLAIVPNKLSLPYPLDDLFWTLLRRRTAPSRNRTGNSG